MRHEKCAQSILKMFEGYVRKENILFSKDCDESNCHRRPQSFVDVRDFLIEKPIVSKYGEM